MLRHFRVGPTGAPELLSVRNLGASSGGEIAGLAVANGRLIVSGATGNGALNAGQVANAHAGGQDAFVATLSTDLTASGADRLTYYGDNRYKTTLAKTGSDCHGGRNSAAAIIKDML